MALSSMTGFARKHGRHGAYSWAWELKSVNAKGLDVRLRLPAGWDAVEPAVRGYVAQMLARGNLYGSLTIDRQGVAPAVRINEPVLAAVLTTIKTLEARGIAAAEPRLDGLLALKGVMEILDEDEREDDRQAAEAAIISGFKTALGELIAMRR